ncbi:MAG: tyrosine-type recombinase/integrase [Actinomycetota bacterium]|nr:tyrosine-type recombinase/integrase [Actinomycetota bacterium]
MGKNANGEGSITYDKRRKRWRARITVETPDGPKRVHLEWFKTRDEAHAALVEALSRDGRRRLSLDAGRVTVAEYFDDWLDNSARHSVTEGIYRQYASHGRLHIKPSLGSEKLSELRAMHVRPLKQELLDKGLAPNTAAYILGTLSTALNQAVADELIPRNPASSVKKPTRRGPSMRVLSAEQTAALIGTLRGTRHEALYTVAAKLGPRQGELAALFWEDLALDRKVPTLVVRRSVATDRAGERWSTTKSGEEREIVFTSSIAETLRRHRTLQSKERLAAKRPWRDGRLVFPNTKGAVNRRASVYENFQRHREKLGLHKMRFHDLRDTAATLMIRGGVDLPAVADILGHADPAMTLRRYSHVLPDMRVRAANIIDSYGF